MSKKKERPHFTVIEPNGEKKPVYTDKQGIEEGLGEIVMDILRKIFK